MHKYNDYLKLTKEYLRNYTYYRDAVKNISAEIEDILTELASESVKTPAYGSDAPGGHSELNSTERAAANRIRLRALSVELSQDRRALERQLDLLDAALEKLPEDEREAVVMFYHDGLNYRAMSFRTHFSERSCRRKVASATQNIACRLFGEDACKDVLFVKG